MQYESKVIRIKYYTQTTLRVIKMTEKELEDVINQQGLLGWSLSSTVLIGMELTLFFSRVKQSLEEMV